MSCTINGVRYEGNNVSIVNGVVTIDGVVQNTEKLSGIVKVQVIGLLNSLTTDASVNCQQVNGNVSAGGSVQCDDVSGNVNAGGSITCGKIGGSVHAGGSICHS